MLMKSQSPKQKNKEMDKKLLFSVTKKDFRVDTFRAGGPGGQNQNKRDTGVRITHIESGAVGESREQRSQDQNKKTAFRRLTEHPKWRIWHSGKVWEALQQISIDERVEEMMQPQNLLIEVKEEGKWVKSNQQS